MKKGKKSRTRLKASDSPKTNKKQKKNKAAKIYERGRDNLEQHVVKKVRTIFDFNIGSHYVA